MWRVRLHCNCGATGSIDSNCKLGNRDLVVCSCGEVMYPVFFEYDIHIAIRGGMRYIVEDILYRTKFKKLQGLDQWTNITGVINGD